MRPVNKGAWPTKGALGVKKRVFNQWQRAIPHLELRTGKFCHLCEMKVTNALAIEHIKPREHFPKLIAHWDNFLLICNYCNSHKLTNIPLAPYRKKYYWPHLNNTLKTFDFTVAGIITYNATHLTTPPEIGRANNTIALYGLDKTTTSNGDSDSRLIERLEAYFFAIQRLNEYTTGVNNSIDAIVDLAKTKGFFSVWLKVFDGVPAVRTALINCPDFHLATTNCFDATLQLQNRTAIDI
jgi:hypothetical protein